MCKVVWLHLLYTTCRVVEEKLDSIKVCFNLFILEDEAAPDPIWTKCGTLETGRDADIFISFPSDKTDLKKLIRKKTHKKTFLSSIFYLKNPNAFLTLEENRAVYKIFLTLPSVPRNRTIFSLLASFRGFGFARGGRGGENSSVTGQRLMFAAAAGNMSTKRLAQPTKKTPVVQGLDRTNPPPSLGGG